MQKQVQTTLAAGWMLLLLVLCATPSEGQGWYRYYGKIAVHGEFQSYTSNIFGTQDGGYLMVGYDHDGVFAWQLDEQGDSVWLKNYGVNYAVGGYTIYPWVVSPVLGGLTMLKWEAETPIDLRLIHLDAWGNVQWEKSLGHPKGFDQARECSVMLTPDQRYLVSGVVDDSLSVFCVDPAGNLDWTIRFHPGGTLPSTWHILPLPRSNNYLMQLNTPSATPPGGYLAFDGMGQMAPKRPVWDTLALQASSTVMLSDGNFLVTKPSLSPQVSFKKITPGGQILFQHTAYLYISGFNFLDFAVIPTADKGWLIVSPPYDDIWSVLLIKFTENGTVSWTSTLGPGVLFDNADIFSISSIYETPDGGYLLAGDVFFKEGHSRNSMLIKIDGSGRIRHSVSSGKIRKDRHPDCIANPDEPVLKNWLVQVRDSLRQITRQQSLRPDGSFGFDVDTSSWYFVQPIPPNAYWEPCVVSTLAKGSAVGDTLHLDLAAKALVDCPFLETDIGTPFLRLCADNTYQLQYCNTGTTDAEGAYIRVVLDPAMQFVSAGQPATQEAADTWRFEVGAIPVGHCGSFPLTVYLDCNAATLGQNHCVEAHIYPDSVCLTPENWSGAEVDVAGDCHPDSVRFFIKNIGTAPTSQLDYIVIEDNIIYRQGQFQLPPNDSIPVTVPANGSTWYLEAEQEPGSPGNPQPSVTIEGCGQNQQGLFSLGFVSQFGEDDGDPFVSVDCRANIGSFDPNDKLAFPSGYGPEHYIRPGQDLEYLIRFQNTGTDTAFRVVLRDTLSPWLDPGSIVPGAASHPYRFYLSGAGVLNVTFDPIALPDSNVNEPASHGFIKFRVRQRAGLPLGTVINNRAAIYFDFNAAVLTNETWHTLGEDVLTQVRQPEATEDLAVFPNPAPEGATLTLQGRDLPAGRFELFDWTGRQVLSRTVVANQLDLPPGGLPTGVYVFVLWLPNGQLGGRGKLMLKG